MKRVFHMTILFVAVFAIIVSCKKNTENTIVNLKTSITEETNSNATYKAFQAKAEEEGYWKIANLFEALAAAEAIHVKNHNSALKKLGEPEFKPKADEPTVKSTAENVLAAHAGETSMYEEMYPGFIRTAEKEKCEDAVNSFTWAKLAEENHAGWISEALDILMNRENDQEVHRVWFVCAQCGGLFLKHFSTCSYCYADTEKHYFNPLIFESL